MFEHTFYTLDSFINFFKEIPEEKWATGRFEINGRCCALGHLGIGGNIDILYDDNVVTLNKLTEKFRISIGFSFGYLSLGYINDTKTEKFPQETPKQRVLVFLMEAKAFNESQLPK